MTRLRQPSLWYACLMLALMTLVACNDASTAATPPPTSAPSASSNGVTPTVTYLPPTLQSGPTVTPAPNVTNSGPLPTPQPGPSPVGGVPNVGGGNFILVSLAQQWLWVYINHQLILDTPITSGAPGLLTPDGQYGVRYKQSNLTFISPWPQGNPNYYAPEHVNYALYFLDVGYYIHDAPWRHVFGPGTNYPHVDADGTHETGSHGCVEVPTAVGQWLYYHVDNGTLIDIYGTAPSPLPVPTATTVPSTATTVPSTATPVPSTATPVPPTVTTVPPTATTCPAGSTACGIPAPTATP